MSERTKTANLTGNFDNASGGGKPSIFGELIFFLLGATLVFSVVAFGAVDAWALSVLSLFSGLTVIFWTANAWQKKEFRFSSSALQIPLLALILIGLIQLLPLRGSNISGDLLSVRASDSLALAPYATRFALVQLFVYSVFFAAALCFINNQKRLRKIVFTIVIFGSLMAFYGILQQLAGLEEIYNLRDPGQAFPFASFVNRHHFAALMEMTIALPLALLFGRAAKKDSQIFLAIAAVVMGMAIVFTSSRGGLLSFLGVLGFVIAANLLKKQTSETIDDEDAPKNYRRNFASIGVGIALILVLFGLVLLLGGDEMLLRGIGLQNQADISNGRTHFWQIALKIFFDYPILGAGLDNYGIAFPQYDTWNGTFRVEQAHNDYLQILADAGVAGFACVAAFIYLLFRQSLKIINSAQDSFRRNVAIGALAGCFGVLIHSFFDFPLRTPANAFFFLILATLATISINSPKFVRKKK